ncbi:hypothetical protein GDO81_001562 [Engystomops pustulosus]|uniref:Uncharacterized bromodomain-containing protein 10 helical domain-containing protein n=1 Tax=Engystomops pustulosus TaxID=76066 RepID=A0AAV7DFQ5_ENGPU|nr:hypothetical protein GDO81_001562 [Engystomops pustulosus]
MSGAHTPGGRAPAPTISLLQMEEKFSSGQYRAIGDFVADFRTVLEECYQLHGADHWLSKQAQKLELMLEQKLSLLSRIKEQEKKEAEEANQKEMEEWDRGLLALAAPSSMETMWEIPAIGHFLCLAQQILNLPEIVFYELERCLLMPQCNVFLAKIMTSLLSPPHRRPTLHRRPNLPYRSWEAALRQKVQQWYTVIGQAENPDRCAEKLGLCSQFFKVLGEVNPLEQKTFHELTFNQKVWLLKGLCDFVYETQSEVQDAVLGQPIHECREVILGYDSQENAYIHFPQFCGADVRVYKQRPLKAPEFPLPSIKIKRNPRVKIRRSKCKYSKRRNGVFRKVNMASSSDFTNPETFCDIKEEDSVNCQIDNCKCVSDNDMKTNIEQDDHSCNDCNMTVSCKENVEKPISPGELVGYGDPLSPGEIRILENVDRYAEATLPKSDSSPLKENALKSYQVHINGSQNDSSDIMCHRVMDIILDHPLLNNKKLRINKMRPKKKKKKKIKDLLNENLQGKCENLQKHTFKSEIHSKLYLNRKQAKHKKHKSGNKSVSKKMVIKKSKKSAVLPASPEFQLVCTNLDELRELIKKIDGELKCMENYKKKSGKWHFRRQSVKELHSTLTRLLKELLPWEPKLQKAFQKNRARLRRDYEDFLKLTNSENVTRETCYREECEDNKSTNTFCKTFVTLQEGKDSSGKLLEEVGMCEKSKIPRQDLFLKELPGRSCKRFNRPSSSTDNEENDPFPQKKMKVSTHEVCSTSLECNRDEKSLEDHKRIDPGIIEIGADIMRTSPLDALKGTKPIQALLAKNLGNKVTLTSQLVQSVSESVSQNVEDVVPVQPAIPFKTSLQAPVQMIYKLPDGHCVPVIHNSSVKIQVQPVLDANTGDKLMQQVLLLPKNVLIQQKDEKLLRDDNRLTQIEVPGKQHMPKVSYNSERTAQLVLPNKSTVHSTTSSTLGVFPSPVTINACRTVVPQCETSKSSTHILPDNLPTSVVPSVISTPSFCAMGGVTSSTGKTVAASHVVNVSGAAQSDLSDAKQELKTVCIRDSQSILVRTRGGNTGLVKVQPSQEQVTPVSNSIFTFTPQLQSYLISRTKTSASPNFSPLIPSPGLQALSVPSGKNHQTQIHNKEVQYPSSGMCKTIEKSLHSSNVDTTVYSGHWPTVSQGITNIASYNSNGQGTSTVHKNINLKQTETCISVPPDTTTPSNSDLLSGSSLHKVVLLTPPSVVPSSNVQKMSVLTTPTSSAAPQKLVFLNTQVPTSSSSANVALQTPKLATPTIIGKTYVKPTETPQIILIPSTMTSPVKTSTGPVVSQVKDVKIGLTIGQTIVNSTSGLKNVLPINILQNTLGKKDENAQKTFAVTSVENFNMKGQNGQITSSNLIRTVPITKASTACTVVAAAKPVSTQSSGNDPLNTLPPFSNSLCPSNGGNTVALSTVKTGHLSSSVLLSTTQTTGHPKDSLSSLKIPTTTTCIGESLHLQNTVAPAYQPGTSDPLEKTLYVSEKFPKMLSTNSTNTQVMINSPLTPSVCKSSSVDSSYQALPPFSPTTVTQLKPQLSDSFTHQKLVINTSTPLAPGTQITINGTRLIVPPQGLGAGSHVLLLSTNTKQGLSLDRSRMHTNSNPFLNNTTIQQPNVKQNMAPIQSSGQSFKNMYSVATSKMLPSLQNTTQYVSNVGSLCPTLTTVPQPQMVPCMPQGTNPQPSKVMQFTKTMPVKEQAFLSMGNSSINPVPAAVVSENSIADPALLIFQSSAPEKRHTVAS